jgi:hypothetical protein
MADFNTDNQRIDDGVSAVRTLLDAHTAMGGSHITQQNMSSIIAAAEHLTAPNLHLTTAHINNISAAQTHIASGGLHITQAERDKVAASPAFSTHTYTGNGDASRRVVIGFRPVFGFLFAVNKPVMEYTSWIPALAHYGGFFSQSGCSADITLENDGLTVRNFVNTSPDGNRPALNQSGISYVIVAAR